MFSVTEKEVCLFKRKNSHLTVLTIGVDKNEGHHHPKQRKNDAGAVANFAWYRMGIEYIKCLK